mmetsp:Transcript_14437/g.12709  ORF Transcript_14437/g.12709 Transcript_14437/m.12709 type:complete len:111 (+) Transcript_14437:50-382(+)
MPRKELAEATRDYTIHLAKIVHKIAFKKRAPRAIREISKFATKEMRTEDIRIDTALNRYIWSNGVRNIPRRVRVRFVRQKNNDDQKSKFYTLVQHVPVDSFKDLQTENAA